MQARKCKLCRQEFMPVSETQLFCKTSHRERAARKKKLARAVGRESSHERGKVHHATRDEAEEALNKLKQKYGVPNAGIYFCCEEGWQITSDLDKYWQKTGYPADSKVILKHERKMRRKAQGLPV